MMIRQWNGWQRLWIVVVVVLLLPVTVLITHGFWPTPIANNIWEGDVFARMKPDDGRRLSSYPDCDKETAAIYSASPALSEDKEFVVASTEDQRAYLKYLLRNDANFGKTSLPDQNACLAIISYFLTGRSGSVVNVEGYQLRFVPDISEVDQNKTIAAYRAILWHMLLPKRVALVGEAFAARLTAAVALYTLGWAIAWVRRGFGAAAS
jgi:hypothetical protein